MFHHSNLTKAEIRALIADGTIVLGGNKRARIYGRLDCKQGKRLLPEDRVFFSSRQEAIDEGYRPCYSCLRQEYLAWQQAHQMGD